MKHPIHEDLYATLHFSLYGVHDSPYIRQTLLLMAVPGYVPDNHPQVDRVFGKEGNQVALLKLQKNRILDITWCWDGVLLTHQFDHAAVRLSVAFKDILRIMDVTQNLADVKGVHRQLVQDNFLSDTRTNRPRHPSAVNNERRGYMIEALGKYIDERPHHERELK